MKNDFQKGIVHAVIAMKRHVEHLDLGSHEDFWKLFIKTMLTLSYRVTKMFNN